MFQIPPSGRIRYFQINTMEPPQTIPASAPHLLVRFQNRENRTTGPNAALEYAKPIHIGSGSWICSSATICGGVTIGKNCIVAAGSVVNRDVPDNCIVAGVPAKVLRKLDEQDRMQVWDTYMKNEVPMSERERGRK